MNEELLSNIEDLGLSEKEARVYLANLMMGPATVQKIADQAEVKRVTAYVILESLASLGLVSQSNQGKKTYFTAEDPISLRRLIEKKEQQITEQKNSFEAMLPELANLKNIPTESPSVKFYDSAEGLKSVMKYFLELNKDSEAKMLHAFSNLDQLFTFFPEFREAGGNPERPKVGIRSKIIYTSSMGPIIKSGDATRMRESRYVPPDKFPLNGDITILGDDIVMLSLTGNKPLGITIHSREIANGLRAVFELAWQTAEPYSTQAT
ncbi:MAG TPA: helix-turn-helix domain-containing protein [Candidatus Saccharimonadales bacterium]|nr:helix-turn-helix domain-containing protein [Candidatus Saccharimonadales bacterium]